MSFRVSFCSCVFLVLLVLRLPRLGKRELILVLFVRLFDLCLFGFVGFLFLLVSGKGCGLCLWHSLDFSLTFFFTIQKWGLRGQNYTGVFSRCKEDHSIFFRGKIKLSVSICAAFGRLRESIWDRSGIRLDTNLKVYRSVVLPTLLYACETWTVYQRHAKKTELLPYKLS